MRCRQIIDKNKVCWFGSYGKDAAGKKLKADNFLSQQDAVATDLQQKLQILKGELWYKISYGQPLFDKLKSKIAIDAFIATTINEQTGVRGIKSFISSISNNVYHCRVEIITNWGNIDINM